MNELFILGELMEGPQNGYQLRCAMQISLGYHRKISFGVIYPLLEKLSCAGFITLSNEPNKRKTNIAAITDKGRTRFFELMEQPVPNGAHNADIYLIKLDAMQHFPIKQQLIFLDKFINEQNITIDDTNKAIENLSKEECTDHWYAQKKLELRIQQSTVAMQWAKAFRKELENISQ
jgi:DNA-binding PadR family transcriptional regulator